MFSLVFLLQIRRGFTNWKNATVSFKNHEKSACHRAATEIIITLPSTTKDIGNLLSKEHATSKRRNRAAFYHILSSIRYLARQGLAIRGHGDDSDGNFIQLLRMKAKDDDNLSSWMTRKDNSYTSPDIQNEIVDLMSSHVLRVIAIDLRKSPFLSIMIDETRDCANTEQVTVVVRMVTYEFDVHEQFLGMYGVPSVDAQTLTTAIKDVFERFNFSFNKLRGQCYDGASAMSGAKSGVARRILEIEPRALFTHCYGHSLNLAACDTMKQIKLLKDALGVSFEITKLLKYSPRREGIFLRLKENLPGSTATGIRVLCPTRWTVRADSLASILENFQALQETWQESIEVAHDTETKARIGGVEAQMNTFDYLFGTMLGHMVLRHTDNLSRALQDKGLSAAEGQQVARMSLETLKSLRTDQSYELFWLNVNKKAEELEIGKPMLPRWRKRPRRFEEGEDGYHHETVRSYYLQYYNETLDVVINCIQERFDQPGYGMYSSLESLLITAALQYKHADDDTEALARYKFEMEEQLERVCAFYGDDFDKEELRGQLVTFSLHIQKNTEKLEKVTIFDLRRYFSSLSSGQRSLLSQVCRLMQLVLVMPATNATSERSFSALRRVKNYLRTTMSQKRFNNLMVLHVHKDYVDSDLDLDVIHDQFVAKSENRLRLFGKANEVQ